MNESDQSSDAASGADAINRYFIGEAFVDTLFHADNNDRDKRAAGRLCVRLRFRL
jgi:hypothetical protein